MANDFVNTGEYGSSVDPQYLTDFSIADADQKLRDEKITPDSVGDEFVELLKPGGGLKQFEGLTPDEEDLFLVRMSLDTLIDDDRSEVAQYQEGVVADAPSIEEDIAYIEAHGWGGTAIMLRAKPEREPGEHRFKIRKLREAIESNNTPTSY